MYAMTGKLVTKDGRRGDVIEILKRAASIVGQLPGCHLYIVNEDLANESSVWIFEMWDDKDAHDQSLKDGRVRSLIAEAVPLLAGAPDGAELRVVGGHGIDD